MGNMDKKVNRIQCFTQFSTTRIDRLTRQGMDCRLCFRSFQVFWSLLTTVPLFRKLGTVNGEQIVPTALLRCHLPAGGVSAAPVSDNSSIFLSYYPSRHHLCDKSAQRDLLSSSRLRPKSQGNERVHSVKRARGIAPQQPRNIRSKHEQIP